jgi:hypothetical protein
VHTFTKSGGRRAATRPNPLRSSGVTLEAALAAAATLVAIAFACSTLDRWLARRRRHELAWTISLTMFAIASGALWLGATHGWTEPTFRVFFLFGAILNVPWLAMGSVYLLYGQRRGDPVALGLAVASGVAVGVLIATPFIGPVAAEGLPRGKDVFGLLPRLMAAVASGVGALVVIGLALLSVSRLLRGRARSRATSAPVASPGRLAAGNLLIVAGTLVLAGSGSLNARLGEMTAFAVTLVAGVVLLFCGFLVATAASSPRVARPPRLAVHAGPPPVGESAEDAAEDLPAEALR